MKIDRSGLAVTLSAMPFPMAIIAIIALPAPDQAAVSAKAINPPAAAIQPINTADQKMVGVYSQAEIRCLARAIWHEARGEPDAGKIAVAEVVIARSKDPRWRGDLCRTIRMPNQFSFVKDGRTLPIDNPEDAQKMMDLARSVASGKLSSPAKGALYYHATYVHPVWRLRLKEKVRLATHVFYSDMEAPVKSETT